MSGIRYSEEFKIEAVKQVTDRGYKIGEVAKRLGVTPKSMHDWIKKYGDTGSQHQTIIGQQDELRQLKAQLRRVTEERDILKEAAVYFASESKKKHVHKGKTQAISSGGHVSSAGNSSQRILCLAQTTREQAGH
jgi:transposase